MAKKKVRRKWLRSAASHSNKSFIITTVRNKNKYDGDSLEICISDCYRRVELSFSDESMDIKGAIILRDSIVEAVNEYLSIVQPTTTDKEKTNGA